MRDPHRAHPHASLTHKVSRRSTWAVFLEDRHGLHLNKCEESDRASHGRLENGYTYENINRQAQVLHLSSQVRLLRVLPAPLVLFFLFCRTSQIGQPPLESLVTFLTSHGFHCLHVSLDLEPSPSSDCSEVLGRKTTMVLRR